MADLKILKIQKLRASAILQDGAHPKWRPNNYQTV